MLKLKSKSKPKPKRLEAAELSPGDIIQVKNGHVILCGSGDLGISLEDGHNYVLSYLVLHNTCTLVPEGTEFVVS